MFLFLSFVFRLNNDNTELLERCGASTLAINHLEVTHGKDRERAGFLFLAEDIDHFVHYVKHEHFNYVA